MAGTLDLASVFLSSALLHEDSSGVGLRWCVSASLIEV